MLGICGDPFKLFGRFMIATFRITGYTIIFIVQIFWYISHMQKDRITDAFGFYGKDIIDAIADVFKD